jgi:hypothetical protein
MNVVVPLVTTGSAVRQARGARRSEATRPPRPSRARRASAPSRAGLRVSSRPFSAALGGKECGALAHQEYVGQVLHDPPRTEMGYRYPCNAPTAHVRSVWPS